MDYYQDEQKYKIHSHSTDFVKNWQKRGKKECIELYCLFIAADSIVDASSFIICIVLWSENKLSQNPARI